jgi:hypothetical protein
VISFSVMVRFEGQSDPLEVKYFFNFLYSLFRSAPFLSKMKVIWLVLMCMYEIFS